MIVFIAIAAVLTLLVVAWVLRPLLRPAPEAGVSSQRLNATIYSDQLQALERDLKRGTLSPADYEAARDELQLRLLDDTEVLPVPPGDQSPKAHHSVWTPRRTAAVVAVLLPLGSVAMYGWLGMPQAINPQAVEQVSQEKVFKMVEELAAKLKANPDNPIGWAMLARSYKVMGRLPEAEAAFVKAGELVNTDPDLLVDYADLLATKAGSNLEGKPLAMLNQALAINPQHPMGLMMTGVAAYRRNDFAGAVAQWEKLLPLMPPGSPDAQQVESEIASARAKGGLPPGAATDVGKLPPVDPAAAAGMTPEKINQMVERLATRLKANPDDAEGWTRLARAYQVQGRNAESEAATAQAQQAQARAKAALLNK
jgi:cytochrome c-type biogenesis protein CcmH